MTLPKVVANPQYEESAAILSGVTRRPPVAISLRVTKLSTVYVSDLNGVKVVVKVYKNAKNAATEAASITSIKPHPCIVKFYGTLTFDDAPYLIYEYLDGQTLVHAPFSPDQETQLIRAIQYIHSHGVAHMDIKPSNVMCVNNTIKIIDFGMSHRVASPMPIHPNGTRSFISPDLLVLTILEKMWKYYAKYVKVIPWSSLTKAIKMGRAYLLEKMIRGFLLSIPRIVSRNSLHFIKFTRLYRDTCHRSCVVSWIRDSHPSESDYESFVGFIRTYDARKADIYSLHRTLEVVCKHASVIPPICRDRMGHGDHTLRPSIDWIASLLNR